MVDKISDNVGKKIVEALKMQADKPSESVVEIVDNVQKISEAETETPEVSFTSKEVENVETSIDNAFQQSLNQNIGLVSLDIDYPENVSVLNNLISKLPIGVSKHTGALIIKQTMEALGIPMVSVLKEAQQVQDMLSTNAKECQKNIIEYKKQISMLEQKAQQYQRQAVVMSDIIALFTKTN